MAGASPRRPGVRALESNSPLLLPVWLSWLQDVPSALSPSPGHSQAALPCSSTSLQPLFLLPSWEGVWAASASQFLPHIPHSPCPVPAAPGNILSPPFLPAPAGTRRHNQTTALPGLPARVSHSSHKQYFLTHTQALLSLPASWPAPTPWQRVASNKHLNRRIRNVHEVQGESIRWKMYSWCTALLHRV